MLNIFIIRTTHVENAQYVKHISSSMGHHRYLEENLRVFYFQLYQLSVGVITFFTNLDELKTNLECPCTQGPFPVQYNILKFRAKTFLELCSRVSFGNCAACQQALLGEFFNVTFYLLKWTASTWRPAHSLCLVWAPFSDWTIFTGSVPSNETAVEIVLLNFSRSLEHLLSTSRWHD